MSTLLQPGRHPDAEQLSAFAEHALPAHEQQETLAHLAGCAECRSAVFLAREAAAQEDALGHGAAPAEAARARADVRGWVQLEDWLSGWRLAFPALGLACLLLLTLYMRRQPAPGGQGAPTAANGPVQAPPVGAATKASEAPGAGASAGAKAGIAQRRMRPQPVRGGETQAAAAVAPAQEAAAAPPFAAAPALVAQEAQPTLQMRRGAAGLMAEGGVAGTIFDAKGLAVARATVTVTNKDTGAQETQTTNAVGSYSITSLQPGNYSVEVVAPGFKRLLQENVTVDATTIARVDQRLAVGGADTAVTITDAPPLLDTADATVGGTIANQLYPDLPLSTNGGPRPQAAFKSTMPGVQENPTDLTSVASIEGAANGNSGIYGGTGQTNLNQNYIEGVLANTVGQQGNSGAISGEGALVASGRSVDAVSAGANGAGAARAKPMAALPSKLPALSVAEGGGWTLAIDTAGAVFRSQDSGATWERVALQWQGRAVTVRLARAASPAASPAAARQAGPQGAGAAAAAAPAAEPGASIAAIASMATKPPPAPAGAGFELTTDAGMVYASRDGLSWARR